MLGTLNHNIKWRILDMLNVKSPQLCTTEYYSSQVQSEWWKWQQYWVFLKSMWGRI